MVVDREDAGVELVLFDDVLQLGLAAAARRDRDDLAVEIAERGDAGLLQHEELARRDVGHRREVDLLAAREGDDGAAALDVDRAVGDEGLAGLDAA